MSLFRNRMAVAILSGAMLAGAFPKLGMAGLAWIAPGCLLFAAIGKQGGEAFRIGYLGGLAYALISLYWLIFIPFPAGAIAGWLALSAYLGLYPALWVWACWRLFPVQRELGREPHLRGILEEYFATSWWKRAAWYFLCAAVWVSLEMILARFSTGFPWNLLGVSQFQILPLIQITSVTGVYGISFVIVWFSVALISAMLLLVRIPVRRFAWLSELIAPILVVGAISVYGVQRLENGRASEENERNVSLALVQPSIPQTFIWDPSQGAERFQALIELSKQALETNPDILIWPEASVPNFLRYDPETAKGVKELVRSKNVWMILGADDAEPIKPLTDPLKYRFYNSSFVIDPEGKLTATYRKRRLVIFGEYVPLMEWLPFLKWFTPVREGFTPGDKVVPFVLPDLDVETSVLICFEDVFPHWTREYVRETTDFLLNLTNNGWFGESAAQWQHAANAAFRAVENGLPLVRSTNNGLTCWVDRFGRLHNIYFSGSDDIYAAGVKQVRVPILGEGELRAPTIYNRYGDVLGWASVGIGALSLGLSLLIRRKSRRPRVPRVEAEASSP